MEEFEDIIREVEGDVRVESSIPVQSRVSLIDLARMDLFYVRLGDQPRSMSELVSRAVNLASDILIANGKMPGGINTVAEAHRYLSVRGLYQRSMRDRSNRKISTALTLENLRVEGVDPRAHSRTKDLIGQQYNMLHNENSVRRHSSEEVRAKATRDRLSEGSAISNEEWESIQRRIKEDLAKELEAAKRNNIRIMRESGLVVDDPGIVLKEGTSPEEINKERAERDRKRIELENSAMPVATAGKE